MAYPIISIKTFFDYLIPTGLGWARRPGPAGREALVPDPSQPGVNTGNSRNDVAAIRWLHDNAKAGDVVAGGAGLRLQDQWPNADQSLLGLHGYPDGDRLGRLTKASGGAVNPICAINRAPGRRCLVDVRRSESGQNPLFDQYGITLLIVGDLENYGAGPKDGDQPGVRLPDHSNRSM